MQKYESIEYKLKTYSRSSSINLLRVLCRKAAFRISRDKMQGLLAKLNKQQRNSVNLESKGPSRSASIASSVDNDEDQQSDESNAR